MDKSDSEEILQGKEVNFEKTDLNSAMRSDTAGNQTENETVPDLKDEFSIPDEVSDLLKDISSNSPSGVDIQTTDDQDLIIKCMNLESELDKRAGNDYEKCEKLATDILTNYSKDLKVVVWLSIAWFRVKGIPGFKNGLILLYEFLRKFGDKLYPQDLMQQSRVLRKLDNDPRLALLNKIRLGDEPDTFTISEQKLNGPGANALPKDVLIKVKKLKGKSFTGETSFMETLFEELPRDKVEHNFQDLRKIFINVEDKEIQKSLKLSESSLKMLEISDKFLSYKSQLTNLLGDEFNNDELYLEAVRSKIGESSTKILRPLLLTIANQSMTDLLNLKEVFDHFTEQIKNTFKENPPSFNNLEHSINQQVERVNNIVTNIFTDIEKLIPTTPAVESPVNESIEKDLLSVADAVAETDQDKVEEPVISEEQVIPEKALQIEKSVSPPEVIQPKISDQKTSELKSIPSDQMLSVQKLKLKWNEDAEIAIKKAINFYFVELDNSNQEKYKVPKDPRIYGISRTFRWGLATPIPTDKNLTGPNETKQNYLNQTFKKTEFDTVIADVETNFMNNDEFLFWLDGQRYVVQALEKKGNQWADAALEIKYHLVRLLDRFPDLPTFKYSDDKTPFANSETRHWLKTDLSKIGGRSSQVEQILPPLMGEDYDSIIKEFDKACKELPNNFEKNAKAMQNAIAGDFRRKGQFLRRLSLANYCYAAGEFILAKSFFDELITLIEDYHIIEWEQALCVSVWQSVYLNNLKLLNTELIAENKTEIENMNKELLKRIGKYDVVMALKLTNHNKVKETKK